MIKELTCSRVFFCLFTRLFFLPSRNSDLSHGFYIFLLIYEPCKLPHLHWEIADPALIGILGHGNTSGCSIGCGAGAPLWQLRCKGCALLSWSLNCQSKACLGFGNFILGSPVEGLSSLIPYPWHEEHGARSAARVLWESAPGGFAQPVTWYILFFTLSLCSEKEENSWLFCLVFTAYICTGFYPG